MTNPVTREAEGERPRWEKLAYVACMGGGIMVGRAKFGDLTINLNVRRDRAATQTQITLRREEAEQLRDALSAALEAES